MAIRISAYRIQISAVANGLTSTFNRATALVRTFATRIRSILNFGVTNFFNLQALTNSLRASLAPFVNVFAEFDDQARFLAGTLNTTVANIEPLTSEARRLGRETAFTAQEVGRLQTEFAKLGFGQTDIGNLTASVLDLGSATQRDLGDVAAVVGSTIRAIGLEATDTGRVVDVLARAFNSSALDLQKFQDSASKVLPVAANLGFTIEETTALIGRLADTGLEASTIGTGLRSIFLELADDSSALSKALGEPIQSLPQFLAALQRLQDSGLDVGEALNLTDKRSVAAFLSLANGTQDVLNLATSLENASGTARNLAAEIEGGVGGSFRRLRSAVEGVLIRIGQGLAPVVGFLADKASDFANALEIDPQRITRGFAELGDIVQQVGVYIVRLAIEFTRFGQATVNALQPVINTLSAIQAQSQLAVSQARRAREAAEAAGIDVNATVDQSIFDDAISVLETSLEGLVNGPKFSERIAEITAQAEEDLSATASEITPPRVQDFDLTPFLAKLDEVGEKAQKTGEEIKRSLDLRALTQGAADTINLLNNRGTSPTINTTQNVNAQRDRENFRPLERKTDSTNRLLQDIRTEIRNQEQEEAVDLNVEVELVCA